MTRHIHRALHALMELDHRFMSDEEIRTLAALLTLYNNNMLYMDERQAAQMTDCFCHEIDLIACNQHHVVLSTLDKVKDLKILKPLSEEISAAVLPITTTPDYVTDFCNGDYYVNWAAWANGKMSQAQFRSWYWYFCSRCPYLKHMCTKHNKEEKQND